MDPVSVIVAALVAGAVKSTEGVAEQSLKDAYEGLKSLVRRFFKDRPAAEVVLQEHENDPETYRAPLAKQLQESGAAQDSQVLEEAQKLLALADPEGTRNAVYNVGSITAHDSSVAAAHIEGGVHMGYNPGMANKRDPS
ncbi:hypothetical protein AB0N33_16275 [Pseudarthrobacter oxydans]|jgi:hypothetical protein|uniref:Uncharacterized protein n=2 Tax=unclassified Arthrobacter TaxID=235627 RepID=I3W1F9_9MICC|nr:MULTISPECIES: hypothetical protein [unclassified Arthrobacter]AFK89436.1 hypothetical protein [Arthrobacter sp. J3.40]AFK89581.1 hypothetical protein [Arthrobacter sp. J3.53]